MSKSKGISPIIAAVLLVAVTLGVVGVFSGWAPQLIQSLTESTTNTTEHRIDCDRASLEIMSATYDSGDTIATVRNRGRTDLSNVTVIGFVNDQLSGQDSNNIPQGSVESFNISGSEADIIEVVSQDCGSVTDRIEDIS